MDDLPELIRLAGRTALLRRARPPDLDGLVELHRRCSAETLRRRFLGAPQTSGRALGCLVSQHATHTQLAMAGAEVVGAGSVFQAADPAELAFLVRDDWQGRGLGRALLRRLAKAAVADGVRAVCLHTYADNAVVRHLLDSYGLPGRGSIADGVLTVRVDHQVIGSSATP
ncbi:GNAT family N-acetyltransferase [Crossiella sp. SN42]|uniref:GNAT family N-acetyltransferase n=1 Tax=Crossiella sp. SN42 TaxID=2944808 RepID=UPI00207D6F8E|nr:GNAT family N-acetyltransferase [Crossiella sp. SN42]MCO1580628.1 GNAT family N-acetyltransferase [Crossiella sp. SN42]